MKIPTFGPNTLYMLLMVLFVIAIFLFSTFLNHKKLIKNTAGKMIAVFHQPGGGESPELCDVHGVFVFRGQPRKGSIFQTRQDVGTAREVYILQVPGATHDELKAAVDSTQKIMNEAAKDAGEVITEYQKTNFTQTKKRKALKDTAMAIQDSVEDKLETTWDMFVSKSMSSRGHMLYPVIMPPAKAGMFQSQVSLPVAHFIEGKTLEVDPVSVALGQFEADPLYNSAMVGSIVDQRLLELAAWFSSYIDKLEQQLLKMINPTVQYLLLGIIIILSLVSAYISFTDHSTIGKMAKQINDYIAQLPTAGE